MNKQFYNVDSSTRTQTRQLTASEKHFSAMLARMQAGGVAPSSDEIDQAGDFADTLAELKDSLEIDGIPGLNKTLQIMSSARSEAGRRLNTLLAAVQEQKEQEEDTRTRLDQRGKRIFVTMTEDDIDELPDLEYLITGILQTATVSLVFGDSNVGKTFFALHIAQCIARGLQWYGRDIKAGPVLYIYAEGIRGLKPRSQAWRKHYNAGKTTNIQFIGFPVHLLQERSTLIDTVASLEATRGEKYALIVVDTFSNCAGGISQNDQMEIAKVLATAHELVRDYGAHVLVVHHTNNTGKFNGSAAFKNHVDTMIELKKADATGPIVMHCEKQRDGEYFKDILLDLQVVELGLNQNYESVTSCVMVLSQSKPAAIEQAEQERAAILDILKENEPLSQTKWRDLCREQLAVKRYTFERHLTYFEEYKLVSFQKSGNGKANMYKVIPTIEDIIKGKNDDNEE
jgi:hypothetical protein